MKEAEFRQTFAHRLLTPTSQPGVYASQKGPANAALRARFEKLGLSPDKRIIPTLVPSEGPSTRTTKKGARDARARGSFTGNLWSGCAIPGGKWESITGTWNVPTAEAGIDDPPGKDGNYWMYAWVGLDGYGENELLQIGVSHFIDKDGRALYWGWYEWLPSGPQSISNWSVKPGDMVCGFVEYLKDGAGKNVGGSITIVNLTTGEHFSLDLNPPAGVGMLGGSAEWIVEDPGSGYPDFSLAAFSPVSFTSCTCHDGSANTGVPGDGDVLNIANAKGTQVTNVTSNPGEDHFGVTYYKSRTGWSHLDIVTATGAPAAAGDPAVYQFVAENREHVMYRGHDGHIHEIAATLGGFWEHLDITAAIGSPTAAGDPAGYQFVAENREHVVYRGNDDHIHELGATLGGFWEHLDITAAIGAPTAAGDPVGYQFAAERREHVIYRGKDGHIHELAATLGGFWEHTDVSNATNAAQAAGDPSGYEFVAENREHVVYRGGDGHIHELAASLGGTWGHFDLSAMTGAPPAAGNPCGYAFEQENRQHIVYRGADGHIHELAASVGGNWGHFDLTTMTGAPPAAGDPSGYVFVAEQRQHVVYRGTDGHIHELAASLGGTWAHFDLTAMTGAPSAAGDPVGYEFTAESRQHVMYRGADGHIHELAVSH